MDLRALHLGLGQEAAHPGAVGLRGEEGLSAGLPTSLLGVSFSFPSLSFYSSVSPAPPPVPLSTCSRPCALPVVTCPVSVSLFLHPALFSSPSLSLPLPPCLSASYFLPYLSLFILSYPALHLAFLVSVSEGSLSRASPSKGD